MKKSILLIVALAVALSAGYYGWHYYQQQKQTELMLYGNVDVRSVNLGFRVAGRLDTLYVDEGDTVKAGQALAKLDSRPYENALLQAQGQEKAAQAQFSLAKEGFREEQIAQAQATVAQLTASYDFARRFYQRQQGLWKSKVISANDLDNAKTTMEQAQANLKAAQDQLDLYERGNRPQEIESAQATLLQATAQLSQAKLNVEDTTIYAPSDGVIMTRAVEPGTMLNTGATALTLSLTDPVWLRAYIDEVNLAYAVPGKRVTFTIDSHPNKVYEGQIGFVSPTSEFTPKSVETPVLRTDLVYRIRIVVTNADNLLRQGMPVTITLAKEE